MMKPFLPLCLALALLPAPARADETAALQARLETLAGRAQRLSDIAAIKRLQRAWGYYLDKGQWDQAAALFAPEGTLEMGADGVYSGPQRIRAYLSARRGGHDMLVQGQLNIHMQLQPVVHVAADGRTARARWRDFGMDGEYHKWARWNEGVLENRYVKRNGIWMIARAHLYVEVDAPYEGGWAAQKAVVKDWRSETARAMPADRAATTRYRPYPEAFTAPFHYAPGQEP